MSGDVMVKTLEDADRAQQVWRHLVGGCAALALPEEAVQVVRLAEDGPLLDVETPGQCSQVQESPCQLEIQI